MRFPRPFELDAVSGGILNATASRYHRIAWSRPNGAPAALRLSWRARVAADAASACRSAALGGANAARSAVDGATRIVTSA